MVNNKVKDFLIPNVTKLPGKGQDSKTNKLEKGEVSEFKNLLDRKTNDPAALQKAVQEKDIKLSVHAARRLKERNLEIDSAEFLKLKDAFDKLGRKGSKDSLVITDKAAYIVDVENNTVVTAVDKESLKENVFTKIDSTIVIS